MRRIAAAAVVVLVLVSVAVLLSNRGHARTSRPFGVYAGNEVPAVAAEDDGRSADLGVRFSVSTPGTVVALRFYKGWPNTGTHIGSLWAPDGSLLAQVRFTSETGRGWQTATLASPVRVQPGTEYVASYYAPHGHYAQAQHVFDGGATLSTNPYVQATAGLYSYGLLGEPTQSWHGSAYYVDPLFVPAEAAPRPSAPPTPSSGASGTAGSVQLTAVDGGVGYYGRFSSNTLPTSPAYFPVGVWEEQYANAAALAGYGVNLIVNPVGDRADTGSVHLLDALDDEVDLWGGPGSGPWTGNYPGKGRICTTSTPCGYTIMEAHRAGIPASQMTYANYSLGVAFWESDTDAARFVNRYQSVVSADLYWGSNPDLCQASQGGQLLGSGADLTPDVCHRASNYGRTVQRLRSLVSPAGSKPVYNFVELGHAGSGGGTMSVTEIRPAVWSSLIAGARGIIYFNHAFGGPCQSQHVMFDCGRAIGRTVTETDAEIAALAPVLNSPTVSRGVTVSGVDALVKWDGRNFYVLTQGGPATGVVSMPCLGDATATVLGEHRTVAVHGGVFSDRFADSNAVHLYRIDGGTRCGL